MKAVNGASRGWIADTSGDGRGVQLSEWEKDDWTYHAKGEQTFRRSQLFPDADRILRHLVITVARGFARPDNVRIDKPQFALGPLGH